MYQRLYFNEKNAQYVNLDKTMISLKYINI